MTTTDQLLIMLIKAVHTASCINSIAVTCAVQDDPAAMKALEPLLIEGQREEKAFHAFATHIL